MSNQYFIFSKDSSNPVDNDTNTQIVLLNNNQHVYLLPKNNLGYYVQNGLFEKNLIEWCKVFANKDKIMLDIGAHTGTYSIALSKHFKTVYAFEPQKMTYYALCGSVALSSITNVECRQFGLGNPAQTGVQTLKIISLDGGGSGLHNTQGVLAEEKIEIKTLDSLNLDGIAFIKMDVEDNELQVLQGSVETLKRCEYPKILFESNRQNDALFGFIKDLGYTIVNINGYNNMFLAQK